MTFQTKVRGKHAIKAAINQKGKTLAQLSIERGLPRDSCAVSLHRPFPKADGVIADFLGKPLHELWPDRYDRDGNRKLSRLRTLAESHSRPTVKKIPVSRHTRGAA